MQKIAEKNQQAKEAGHDTIFGVKRSLELFKCSTSSSLNTADVLNEIGLVYELMEELDEALVYFEQSLEMKRSLQSSYSSKSIEKPNSN